MNLGEFGVDAPAWWRMEAEWLLLQFEGSNGRRAENISEVQAWAKRSRETGRGILPLRDALKEQPHLWHLLRRRLGFLA